MSETQQDPDRLFGRRSSDEEKKPASDFKIKEIEDKKKKTQTKRIKLNQAIQTVYFNNTFEYDGENISIAEALEIRKHLNSDLDLIKKHVLESAFKRVIHKEERDIVYEPKQPFKEKLVEYHLSLKRFRELLLKIHVINHECSIAFKEETEV